MKGKDGISLLSPFSLPNGVAWCDVAPVVFFSLTRPSAPGRLDSTQRQSKTKSKKAIGVSNYCQSCLDCLLGDKTTTIVPAVNQIQVIEPSKKKRKEKRMKLLLFLVFFWSFWSFPSRAAS